MAHRLSLPTMFAFGFGQVSEAVKNAGFNTFLLFYYNQVLHVSATGTSVALAIALIFDAVTDPIAGSLSDKLKSRWGRRHPFILIAAFPLAITFYFLFNPPEELSEIGYILWLTVFAVMVRASMTFYHVPHLALGAEMAGNYEQRSTLFAFSTFFGFMGGVIFVPMSYLLFFPTTEEFNPALLNQEAYGPWAASGGFLMIFAIIVCVFGTKHEIPRLREQQGVSQESFGAGRLLRELRDAFSNKSFRALFFGMILSMFIISVEAVFTPFMNFHFWGMTTEQLAFIPIGMLVGLCLSIIMVPILTKKFDKRPTLIGCAIVTILNINAPIVLMLLDPTWFPEPGSTALLIILIFTNGITALLAPIIFATINSMFADIADDHELEIGERREGVIFAARSFANKASASVGLVIGGLLIDYINFPRGASLGDVPADTIWQLGLIAGPLTSIFTMLGLVLYLRYRIDRKRHQEILSELNRRRTNH